MHKRLRSVEIVDQKDGGRNESKKDCKVVRDEVVRDVASHFSTLRAEALVSSHLELDSYT